jgi:AP endonuclease 2
VVVYVRQSLVCLKAEEGLTGRLKSSSGVAFQDLPENEKIGGYPVISTNEALELDNEGRAVILELKHFIFISIYSPAVTVPQREIYRIQFLATLEERIRNLLAMGKSVIVAGDVNICRAPIDTADPVGHARRTESGVFEDTKSRRWLKSMLRPEGPFIDTGRHFHPDRTGMYTCKLHQEPSECRLGDKNSSSSGKLW